MRLLNTRSLALEEFDIDTAPPYAILSHRWEEDEVLFKDLETDRARTRKGFKKLASCCKTARAEAINYVWIDTCCIDKSSSAELQESINSMYRWYQKAEKCYAYLADVRCEHLKSKPERKEFISSVWFTRGWTLQELIAPSKVIFFNRYWEYLGHKLELCSILSKVTSIDEDVLSGKMVLSKCPVGERMAWAAKRTTTRVEDRAYSLLGIFNVYMPMLYGEGERAFQRLQEEIIKQSDDHTLFAWQDREFGKSFLAPTPSCFTDFDHLTCLVPTNDTSQGYNLVNAGLSIHLELIPWSMHTYLAPLRCGYISSVSSESTLQSSRGYERACLFLQQTTHDNHFIRVSVSDQDLLVMNGDDIAEMRDLYGIQNDRILIRKLDSTSDTKPAKSSFYGFTFSFQHHAMFRGDRSPAKRDVLCMHLWRPDAPFFGIRIGKHHTAGLFRLSGFSIGLFMFLGFDKDFTPLCLITSQSPQSRRFSLLPPDFSKMSHEDALRLLDINWLRSQIAQGTHSNDTILAFRGDRRTRTEVDCRNLSLALSFDWVYDERVGRYAWLVDLKPLRRSDGRIVSSHFEENPIIYQQLRGRQASGASQSSYRDAHTEDQDDIEIRVTPRRSLHAGPEMNKPRAATRSESNLHVISEDSDVTVRRERNRSYYSNQNNGAS